jgi:hypothetical protein
LSPHYGQMLTRFSLTPFPSPNDCPALDRVRQEYLATKAFRAIRGMAKTSIG